MIEWRVKVLCWLLLFGTTIALAQSQDTPLSAEKFAGLKLRALGPALMSGRIADIAMPPGDPHTWYVAVGSGGVWKTINAGTTWTPLFDRESVYSIGSITLDPSNPNVVWVGTGENIGGRHVGFGDGVYRSADGGAHWEKKGLEDSEHISKIIVHPNDPNTIWVAAQGPLWSKGGQRGLYKSTDGGDSWYKTLGDDVWTGVTDVLIDPRNPAVLYAATWERHRSVAAYMGGGMETGIYRSGDGGDTWVELTQGLPDGAMGKIGLAISDQKPDVLYAAIELNRREGAVYRSTDRGASWQKQSDTVSGATGPHYYQELYASPHVFDRLYLVNNNMLISDDGGKTFVQMNEENKHGDNHAIAFRADDPDYLLVGSDGGLYESFDLAATWRYIANLPVTQFYKVAVDDAEPFYRIYGGTQDNSTQGGPSRTDNRHGIRNSDWFITVFADGHQPATEPGNPDIVYSEWQQGNLVRFDRTTGEIVYIQPQPEPGDAPERFNWDSPILLSPHRPTTLYFASQRVWRSDDRGDSWRTVSGDLTRNQDRMLMPLMGRQQSWDAPWDMLAMSAYNSITSLAESPRQQGLLYAGTDDGLLQVSEDGGNNWRRIEVGSLPGVPDTAFINDIKADLFDADTVYVALDNHKFGDYRPYLLKSTDRGRRWRSMAGDLPARHLVWRLVQDHEQRNLFFTATEFGIFFSVDAGAHWTKLNGGVPTISFRDLAIQRRENDLVGASFGRGFFVLDDYSALRHISAEALQSDALFPVRRAWWYIEQHPLGFSEKASQGDAYYNAPNPPYGAVFTYYLAEGLKTRRERRQEQEKSLLESGDNTPYPGWLEVEAERTEPSAAVVLTVRDVDGNVVRRVQGETKQGFHRVAWDLRFPALQALGVEGGFPTGEPQGFLAAPGTYSVSLTKQIDGETVAIGESQTFQVQRMYEGALKGAEPAVTAAFWSQIATLQRATTAAGQALDKATERMDQLRTALARSQSAPETLDEELAGLAREIEALVVTLNGVPSKQPVGEVEAPTINRRLQVAILGTSFATYGPTPTHRRSFEVAQQEFSALRERLNDILERRLPELEAKLAAAGAPWVPGQPIPPGR